MCKDAQYINGIDWWYSLNRRHNAMYQFFKLNNRENSEYRHVDHTLLVEKKTFVIGLIYIIVFFIYYYYYNNVDKN